LRVGNPIEADVSIIDKFDGNRREISIDVALPFVQSVEIEIFASLWDGAMRFTVTPLSKKVKITLSCDEDCIWRIEGVAVEDLPKVKGPIVWLQATVYYKTEVGSFILGYSSKLFEEPNLLIITTNDGIRLSIAKPGPILTRPTICVGDSPNSLTCKVGWSVFFPLRRPPNLVVVKSNGEVVICESQVVCWRINGKVVASCNFVQCSDCNEDVIDFSESIWSLIPNVCFGDPIALQRLKSFNLDAEKALSLMCPPKPKSEVISIICKLRGVRCIPPLSEVAPDCECLDSSSCKEVAGNAIIYHVVGLLFLIGTVYAIYQLGRRP